MIYDIYDLGTGQPDLMAVIRAGAIRGDLRLRRRFTSGTDRSMTAEVLEPGTHNLLMGPLNNVRAGPMNTDTWVIQGVITLAKRPTQKSSANHYHVRWLCKVPGAKAVIDPAKVAMQYKNSNAVYSASGFHPKDDNLPDQTAYAPLDPSID